MHEMMGSCCQIVWDHVFVHLIIDEAAFIFHGLIFVVAAIVIILTLLLINLMFR